MNEVGLLLKRVFLLFLAPFLIFQFTANITAQISPLSLEEIQTALSAKLPNRFFKNKEEVDAYIVAALRSRGFAEIFSSRVEEGLAKSKASPAVIAAVKEFAAVPTPDIIFDEKTGNVTGLRFNASCGRSLEKYVGTLDVSYDNGSLYLSIKNGSTILVSEEGGASLPESLTILMKMSLQSGLLKKGQIVTGWYIRCGSGGFTYLKYLFSNDDPRSKNVPARLLTQSTDPNSDLKRIGELIRLINDKTEQVAKRLYAEIPAEISSAGKGEFETTAQYEQRMKELDRRRAAINPRLIREAYTEAKPAISEFLKLSSSYSVFPLQARLLNYDADSETFGVEIEGKTRETIYIPISDGPKFKQRFPTGRVYLEAFLDIGDEKPKIACGSIWYEDEESRMEITENPPCEELIRLKTVRDGLGSGDGDGNKNSQGVDELNGVKQKVGPTAGIKIIYFPRPGYTESARNALVAGDVTLEVTFLASGEVGEISVVSGLPNGLTETAIDAAKRIRFQPAQRNGVPYAVTKQIRYTFTLY